MSLVGEATEARSAEDFAAVYDAHHIRLLRVAYLLRGDAAAAEDDVADAFARTLRPWLDGRVNDVGAYLRTAVVNASRARWRLAKRQPRSGPAGPSLRTHEDDVAEREDVRAVLARLPRGQREALVLRYLDDLSERATAQVLGVSLGTVKSQVARGLIALRDVLEGDDR